MNINIYKNMNQKKLDAAYNNKQAVGDFPALLKDFQDRSNHTYEKYNWIRDLKYGSLPRERYDFLSCGINDAPTYLFIHGGYWSNCTKEDFSFIAEGIIAHKMNVILAEYTLAPEATMTEIVKEIGMLIDHIIEDTDEISISTCPLYLAGHSAGGHLAALYRSHAKIIKTHMISALVDLNPISLIIGLQDKLNLTPDEISSFSPLLHIQKGSPTLISVGAHELSEFVLHSTEYAIACEKKEENVGLLHLPKASHFSMLNDLADPQGLQLKALLSI